MVDYSNRGEPITASKGDVFMRTGTNARIRYVFDHKEDRRRGYLHGAVLLKREDNQKKHYEPVTSFTTRWWKPVSLI